MNPPSPSQQTLLAQRGFLPAKLVASAIGRDIGTVYRWLDGGKIVGTRVGRSRYVHVRSAADYLGPVGAALLEPIVLTHMGLALRDVPPVDPAASTRPSA